MPAEVIAEARASIAERPQMLPILPECWHAVTLFVLMQDQWRMHISPMGQVVYQGLDLAALPLPMAAARQRVRPEHRRALPDLMDQLQMLANAARRVLNG